MKINTNDSIGAYYFQRTIFKANEPSDGCVVTLFPDGEMDIRFFGWSETQNTNIKDYGISQSMKWLADLYDHLNNLENENVSIKSGVYHFCQKPKEV